MEYTTTSRYLLLLTACGGQGKLQSLGVKIMGLKATRRECKERGGAHAAADLEGHTDNLR